MKKLLTLFMLLASLKSQIGLSQVNGTILHNGLTRNYIVYVPSAWQPGDTWPLVYVLHGFTQSSSTIMNVSDFNAVADTGHFIVAYPNGVGNAWNTNSGMTGGSTADDIGFISALTDTLQALYNIDANRVFSCGFSAGGYMSHRLACESPRCYAAIASVAGTMSNNAFSACAPARSVPVLQIHGTSDLVVSYNGSVFGGKSVNDVIGLWVGANVCAVPPFVQTLPDINTQDNSTVEKSVYAPCNAGVEVNLLKVIGGGHQWPGTTALLGGLGAINRDINASGEIWNFFRNYSCAVTAGLGDQLNAEAQQFTWYRDPYSGDVTVAYSGQGNFEVELFDLSGKSISQQDASVSIVLNTIGLNAGVYLLKAVAGKSVSVFKIQL